MAAKPPVRKQTLPKKLIVSSRYTRKLLEIAEHGYDLFGAKVSDHFIARVENKVMALPAMPNLHPKNRFIESSDQKTFRNILVEKYAVLYSVTARTIHVITIYHQAMNPETIKKFVK